MDFRNHSFEKLQLLVTSNLNSPGIFFMHLVIDQIKYAVVYFIELFILVRQAVVMRVSNFSRSSTVATSLCILTLILVIPTFAKAGEAENSQNKTKPICSCEPISIERAYHDARYVIFGEVKSFEMHADDLATGKFHERDIFKGKANYIKKVVGASKPDASCRQVLEKGYYLVFSRTSQNVVLNQCAPSRQLKPGSDLVQTLGYIQRLTEKAQEGLSDQNIPSSFSSSAFMDQTQEQSQQHSEQTLWFDRVLAWFRSILAWIFHD